MSGIGLEWFIIGGAVLITALIVVASIRSDRKRREALSGEAALLGARFEAKPDAAFLNGLKSTFWVFRYHRRRTVTNLIERPGAGATFQLFDYAYMRPGSRSPSFWSILLTSSETLQLPKFMMGNRGGALRLRDGFRKEPVVFPVHEFMESHQVHSDDDETAGVFSDDLQRFFGGQREYCMEGAGTQFVLYVPDRRVKPEQIREIFEHGAFILRELTGAMTNR